jgi:transposase
MSPKGGRKPINNRDVFEGIAWVLRSGACWKDLPPQYPSASTCWRRLQQWEDQGVWLRIWRKFLSELDERKQLEWEETFADGSFAPAKKGVCVSERPNVEKVRSGWWWSMARESLIGAHLDSALPSEVALLETTIDTIVVPRSGRGRPRKNPYRIVADRGYDSDPLRRRLAKRGIDLICPYRQNNKHMKYHDGRKMRRYKRRWTVERTFACRTSADWSFVMIDL